MSVASPSLGPGDGSAALREPPPAVDLAWISAEVSQAYGLDGELSWLRSERDRNALLVGADGRAVVVKVANSAEDAQVLDMENAAYDHLAAVAPTLTMPRLVRTAAGSAGHRAVAPDGRTHSVRLVSSVPGTAADLAALPPSFAHDLGDWSARTSRALSGFFHPAAGRSIEWDPRRVGALRGYVDRLEQRRREGVRTALDRVSSLADRTRRLPSGVQHADLTMSNVLVDTTGITAVVDLGDMHHTARVCDLGITLASLLRVVAGDGRDPWPAIAELLDGYQQVQPLEPDEVDALGEVVLARLLATVLISAWRAPDNPDNLEYLTGLDGGSWAVLDALEGWSADRLAARLARIAGTARSRPTAAPGLRERRAASLGGSLVPLFYEQPLEVVSGSGVWLEGADGRRSLDAYNNVPVVGHAHPAVVQAVTRQAALVNTHVRYLHQPTVELAERLLATMPEPLDTVVFVNSGSEAVDLAWRLATAATGHSGALVTSWAYHGVTAASAALSSNTWRGAGPDHVAVFDPPYPGDRALSGADARGRVAAAVEQLSRRGHRPALIAFDPMFTSPGVLDTDPDFVDGLAATARAAGALVLADEVQSGLGRCGGSLWRHADLGLVPDLVTLGKPMGNGMPLAAVVTRRDVTDRLDEEFFSTFGGNPVACAAGLAVLDVIEERDLVRAAETVGQELRRRLTTLATTTPALGAVRGRGLVVGVDVAGEGSDEKAAAIVEGMRARGVLIGRTGPAGNVLKIRPPLVFTSEHARLLVDAMAETLSSLDTPRQSREH